MGRILGIIVALCVPAAVVLGLAWSTSRPGLPVDPQAALDQYLAYKHTQGYPAATAQQVQRAPHPRNFTAAMSRASFGAGVYYQVSYAYQPAATAYPYFYNASISITTSVGLTPMADTRRDLRPLPYPPEDIWCIWLRPAEAGAPPVVLVALHQDWANAAWQVHELSGETQAEVLAAVGCIPAR